MKHTIVIFGVLFGLAGCAQPSVTLNPAQSQYRIDYTQHWQLLAERTVDVLIKQISKAPDVDIGGHVLIPTKSAIKSIGSRPYYIHAKQMDSPFSKLFTPLLQQELQKRGYTVMVTPHNTVVVNYSAQTFLHGANGSRHPLEYSTFWATAVALGYAARNLPIGAALATAVGAAAVLDTLLDTQRVTRGETVLTTTVVFNDRIIHQNSESFYVAPANLPFYWSQYPSGTAMETEMIRPFVEPTRSFRVQAR